MLDIKSIIVFMVRAEINQNTKKIVKKVVDNLNLCSKINISDWPIKLN